MLTHEPCDVLVYWRLAQRVVAKQTEAIVFNSFEDYTWRMAEMPIHVTLVPALNLENVEKLQAEHAARFGIDGDMKRNHGICRRGCLTPPPFTSFPFRHSQTDNENSIASSAKTNHALASNQIVVNTNASKHKHEQTQTRANLNVSKSKCEQKLNVSK